LISGHDSTGNGVTDEQRIPGTPQGIALIAAAVMPVLAIVSLVPNLPLLFQHFGAVPHHELLVPMIITLPSLCIALFSPLMGMIADFWGRRRLLIVALVAFTFLGLIPLFLEDLHFILASRFIVGIAEAAILTTGNAMLGDYFAGEQRQKWLSIQTTVGPIAASVLILAGGKLGSINWHGPFALYSLGLIVLIWVIFAAWEPKPADLVGPAADAIGVPFPWNKTLIVGCVTIGLSVIYFVQAVQLGRIFSELGAGSPQIIGVVITLASIGVVLGGLVYRRLSRRSIPQMFAVIFIAFAVGYLGLAFTPSYKIGLPFAIIAQFANGLTVPTLISWALTKYDRAHRGRGMGIWGSCFFIGTFLSPPLVSIIGLATGGFLKSVATVGAACLVVAVTLWIVSTVRRAPAVLASS
jgi:MFS family permease